MKIKIIISTLIFCLLSLNCKEEKTESTIAEESAKNPMADIYDITPLADGGAYAMGGLNRELWYLRQNVAFLVVENKIPQEIAYDSLNTDREKYLWAQLQREKKKRVTAEMELDDANKKILENK